MSVPQYSPSRRYEIAPDATYSAVMGWWYVAAPIAIVAVLAIVRGNDIRGRLRRRKATAAAKRLHEERARYAKSVERLKEDLRRTGREICPDCTGDGRFGSDVPCILCGGRG